MSSIGLYFTVVLIAHASGGVCILEILYCEQQGQCDDP